MNLAISTLLFIAGLGLVIYFAEKLVKGTVGMSLSFGISAFLISVIFIGFDPENLALGGVAAYEGVAGIALGSIIGASMVAIALAFGITALLAPMRFAEAPKAVLAVPILAVLLLFGLAWDGELSRIDGAILLGGFAASLLFLIYLSKRGLDIRATGEVAETLEEAEGLSRWRSVGLFAGSLVAIIVGSELVVTGSEQIIARFGLSETVFGMTILALLVSIEELARELPAARKGRPDISYGNVAGSILAFFLCNAGIIALIRPVSVSPEVLSFYLPVCLITVATVSIFMLRKQVSRMAGIILLALYGVFFVGGYIG
ncbi:MAG: sodium:calcium antiporter [Gammaproteobacteria bacterium]|nr:sodium:calcium antiporter [Gammaproteobacteria bacterium]